MNLRALAENDLENILEDAENGFGYAVSITDPDGVVVPDLIGYSTDIAFSIDPDTGQAVSGRAASVALRLSTLYAAGLNIPRGIPDTNLKPWVISFSDINGFSHVFKISQSHPDRALGVIVCQLESYNNG